MKKSEPDSPRIEPAVVLVVDDEPSICWAFERMLSGDGHEVLTASSAEEGLRIANERTPDLVLLDVRLPKEDGISALPKFITATDGPVIIMTAFGDLETAVAAVKNGASEYLIKPFSLDNAQAVCNNALRTNAKPRMPFTPVRDAGSEGQIIGRSAAIQQAFRQIALVAGSDLSVLITGETGTGKELVAAAIHRHSHRASGPYLPVAPVSLNPDLIESELFGHAAGAFTGAVADRAGLFEKAEGGTVLLDEIGDLPLSIQVKLLRVLEQGEFTRVGEVESRRCNVRMIAATHRDLHRSVLNGEFREDLFYRLNGLHIHLPPLRERVEDLLPLCEHFLQRIQYADAQHAISDDLLAKLHRRKWYGNVRELRNAVQHAAVVARGRPLAIDDFPDPQPGRLQLEPDQESDPRTSVEKELTRWLGASTQDYETSLYEETISLVEPTLLRFVLESCNGNRAKAAERLGIHRGTLREKLRKYGLDDSSSS
jgi:two-component system nitrogen regulation response regulator GlnG